MLIDEQYKKQLIKHLSEFITEDRLALFYDNLKQRTSRITIVLEDIFHSQNASAVLRTADCFGIQNIHIIENRNQHNINHNVSLGSSKWLTETFYNKSENNTK
ncbi:MAG: TrmH family RNA methyltransferase, partial [Flavobacteriales bacterium]|nr:TrmH family RNA methyltransferase [Flavobacteriales bacterium]